MSLVVFTGGARSGKSAAAQRLAQGRELDGHRVTVAVFGRPEVDEEFALRVAMHRASRPSSWHVVEAADSTSWLGELPQDGVVLVDCLGTLLGRVMEEEFVRRGDALSDAPPHAIDPVLAAAVDSTFGELVDALSRRTADTIVVTNEVGNATVPAFASERLFRDLLGRANARMMAAADAGYLCVAGRLVRLDTLPLDAHWPED